MQQPSAQFALEQFEARLTFLQRRAKLMRIDADIAELMIGQPADFRLQALRCRHLEGAREAPDKERKPAGKGGGRGVGEVCEHVCLVMSFSRKP